MGVRLSKSELKRFGLDIHPQSRPGGMNRVEARYAAHLQVLQLAGEILWFGFEALNLRLAAKCYYRPDFAVLNPKGLYFVEVKGFWRDDALVKIKVAAEQFPFRFFAVRWTKGSWEEREFLGSKKQLS